MTVRKPSMFVRASLTILAAFVVWEVIQLECNGPCVYLKTSYNRGVLAHLCDAIDAFQTDCGRYPTQKEGLGALVKAPPNAIGWKGPYLDREIGTDPWGQPYMYFTIGRNGDPGYLVESFGADGQRGGTGDDADVFDGSK